MDTQVLQEIKKRHIESKTLNMFLKSSLKWYEFIYTATVILISTVLPLSLAIKLFSSCSGVLMKNPDLRMAKELKAIYDSIKKE